MTFAAHSIIVRFLAPAGLELILSECTESGGRANPIAVANTVIVSGTVGGARHCADERQRPNGWPTMSGMAGSLNVHAPILASHADRDHRDPGELDGLPSVPQESALRGI